MIFHSLTFARSQGEFKKKKKEGVARGFQHSQKTQRMLMNDKIIFDHYYCINSAETKEIMAHYILQPHHIFIRVKAFNVMLVQGGLKFVIISMCYAWRPVKSISKSHILTARTRVNCNINAWLSLHY